MATGEELYESEVLFPDHHQAYAYHDVPSPPAARRGQITCPATASSRPVDIPTAAVRRWSGADLQADDGGCGGGTMVPPHVMVSRRRSEAREAAAFSLRSGTGRPARRDLSHLRNSVLRMTGFIEG